MRIFYGYFENAYRPSIKAWLERLRPSCSLSFHTLVAGKHEKDRKTLGRFFKQAQSWRRR